MPSFHLNNRLITLIAAAALAPAPVAAQQPPAKIVQVAQVAYAEMTPTVSVPGTIYSRNEVQITAGVAGRLSMVAEPGTLIEAGEVVASIDQAALKLQRAEQEALLERAEISLRQLESQLRRQRELAGSVTWLDPRGGFFLWATLPDVIDAHAMVDRAIAQGVIYVSGNAFFVDGSGETMVRLSFSAPSPARIDEGIRRLAETIRAEISARAGTPASPAAR